MSFDLGNSGTSRKRTVELGERLSSIGGNVSQSLAPLVPGLSVANATQDASILQGVIGSLSSAAPLQALAGTAKTAGKLTPIVSPLVTATTARAAYRAATVVAQARQDEVTAVAYKQVFESISSAADAGIASITMTFTAQQQSEIVPLLQRNGYAVTVGAAIANSKNSDNVEIKWA